MCLCVAVDYDSYAGLCCQPERLIKHSKEVHMLTIEQVKEKLKPMNLQYVSRETGIHGNILYRIMKGQRSASYETVKKLSDWLEGQS